MPVNPVSPLAAGLAGEGIPPDVIVVRGYPAPFDPLAEANRLLEARHAPPPAFVPIAVQEVTALINGNNAPGRIYLTGRLDCWIEVDDWGASFVRAIPDNDSDRRDAFTIWLRQYDQHGHRIRYHVGTRRELDPRRSFVAGQLVEDFLSGSESRQGVWDEQQYGPVTYTASLGRCF
jgi:hypothetical protein